MNLGIVTSYIVAGVILIGIVMMNLSVQGSSAELTITQMQRQYVANITDMLNDDLSNMGSDVNDITRDSDGEPHIIECATDNRISFYRNLCQTNEECADENRQPELIEWRLLTEDEISDSNPNHRTLRRTVTTFHSEEDPVVDENDINVGVTQFNIEYYRQGYIGSDNNTTGIGCGSGVENIRQLKVMLEVQSAERVRSRPGAEGRFIRSVWDKRFTPPNLQIAFN